ncbi:MAG: transglutaminase-like cysteine peptidase [Magnetococcales bacterium]|nr:transglutaminase-like cysteine peptidase [Magnetococcales bacterium]
MLCALTPAAGVGASGQLSTWLFDDSAGQSTDASGRSDKLAQVLAIHAQRKPTGWDADLAMIRGLPIPTRLQSVQELVNRHIRYTDDPENIWLAPVDSYPNGGDCEDYAVAKLLLLQESGFPAKDLRIVVLAPRQGSGIYHVILTARWNDKIHVLDSPNRVPGDRVVTVEAYRDADRSVDWSAWSGGMTVAGRTLAGGERAAGSWGVAHGVPSGMRRVISYRDFPANEKLVRIAADWLIIHPWEPPLTPSEVERLRLLRVYYHEPTPENAQSISGFEVRKLEELRRIRKAL